MSCLEKVEAAGVELKLNCLYKKVLEKIGGFYWC